MEPAHPPSRGRQATAESVEGVWRIESARLIATLSRITGDFGLAEDIAQDALVKALETWPETGVPENPAAWLMATARNRGIDRIRRDQSLAGKYRQIAGELELAEPEPGPHAAAFEGDRIGDDLLTLIFTACHPALTTESQVALTLKSLAGLSTDEIARAFLVSNATVSQRIVRAKRTLSESEVGFEPPAEDEMGARLAAVLGVIYLIFNEGYSATAGEEWMRTDLSAEALRLGRILAGLVPGEPEVHGLVALMEIQASRFPARIGPDGAPVLLLEQDRSLWDRLLIRRGLERLELARGLDGKGPYVLQLRSQPVMPVRQPRGKRTGRRSLPCTTNWRRSETLRSPNSTGRSRSRWPATLPLHWRRLTGLSTTGGWPGITCCPAQGETHSKGSAATRKQRLNSNAPPRSPQTSRKSGYWTKGRRIQENLRPDVDLAAPRSSCMQMAGDKGHNRNQRRLRCAAWCSSRQPRIPKPG